MTSVTDGPTPAPGPEPSTVVRRGVWRESLRYWGARVGIVLSLALVGLALLGPALAPYSPTEILGVPFERPSGQYPLGLDYLGRDGLSRFLYGGRTVIALALLATVLGVAVGASLGLYAAYVGRWPDGLLMRLCDAFISFPAIILVLVLVSAVGPKLWLVVGGVALTHIPRVARLVRAATLEVLQQDYVVAAEVRGERMVRILGSEVLPNIKHTILADFGLRIGGSVIMIASLSFLGVGLQPPAADWGLMINENRQGLTVQPYVLLVPALAIALLTIGVNLTADAIARASGREHTVGRRE